METKTCKECNQVKTHIKSERQKSSRGYNYRDQDGRLWHRRLCPDCNLKKVRSYSIQRKWGTIDDVMSVAISTGRKAERSAEAWLKKNGETQIELTKINGPDVVVSGKINLEVKSVLKKATSDFWFTTPVNGCERKKDHAVIIVYNQDVVAIIPMEKFLLLTGCRTGLNCSHYVKLGDWSIFGDPIKYFISLKEKLGVGK